MGRMASSSSSVDCCQSIAGKNTSGMTGWPADRRRTGDDSLSCLSSSSSFRSVFSSLPFVSRWTKDFSKDSRDEVKGREVVLSSLVEDWRQTVKEGKQSIERAAAMRAASGGERGVGWCLCVWIPTAGKVALSFFFFPFFFSLFFSAITCDQAKREKGQSKFSFETNSFYLALSPASSSAGFSPLNQRRR